MDSTLDCFRELVGGKSSNGSPTNANSNEHNGSRDGGALDSIFGLNASVSPLAGSSAVNNCSAGKKVGDGSAPTAGQGSGDMDGCFDTAAMSEQILAGLDDDEDDGFGAGQRHIDLIRLLNEVTNNVLDEPEEGEEDLSGRHHGNGSANASTSNTNRVIMEAFASSGHNNNNNSSSNFTTGGNDSNMLCGNNALAARLGDIGFNGGNRPAFAHQQHQHTGGAGINNNNNLGMISERMMMDGMSAASSGGMRETELLSLFQPNSTPASSPSSAFPNGVSSNGNGFFFGSAESLIAAQHSTTSGALESCMDGGVGDDEDMFVSAAASTGFIVQGSPTISATGSPSRSTTRTPHIYHGALSGNNAAGKQNGVVMYGSHLSPYHAMHVPNGFNASGSTPLFYGSAGVPPPPPGHPSASSSRAHSVTASPFMPHMYGAANTRGMNASRSGSKPPPPTFEEAVGTTPPMASLPPYEMSPMAHAASHHHHAHGQAQDSILLRNLHGVFLLQPTVKPTPPYTAASTFSAAPTGTPPISPLPTYALPPAMPSNAAPPFLGSSMAMTNGTHGGLNGNAVNGNEHPTSSSPAYGAPPPYSRH